MEEGERERETEGNNASVCRLSLFMVLLGNELFLLYLQV